MSEQEQDVDPVEALDAMVRPEQDWLIEKLVAMLNSGATDTALGMTLNVGGLIVSGSVIGGREYFTKFGDNMAQGMSDESQAQVADFFGAEKDWYGPEGTMLDSPSFLHMRDARFFSSAGNPIPGNQGLLWRTRIAAIDAFSMGTLAVSKD
jgi:hypothetical protein